jgi:hypothetical protein
MFSLLKKGLVYKNISSDIVEHDLDIDADQWSYDGKDVYRGAIDPTYLDSGLNVYWLYDDNSKRVGLAEHDAEDAAVFHSLWFHENPYATLFQDEAWKTSGKTLWSKISNEAYQDLLELDFKTVHDQSLNIGVLLITPEILLNKPDLYTCEKCGKKSLMAKNSCPQALVSSLEFSQFSILFLDDDFVIYEKPTLPQPPPDACEQELQGEQNELPAQLECQDAQPPQEAETPLPAETQEHRPHPQL